MGQFIPILVFVKLTGNGVVLGVVRILEIVQIKRFKFIQIFRNIIKTILIIIIELIPCTLTPNFNMITNTNNDTFFFKISFLS